MSHSTTLQLELIIFIISNKMNGTSEYHKRRVYSSSNHYGLIYQFVTIEYFTKVDVQEEKIEVHFSDNFGRDLVE